jgi:hypothetical protein
MNKCVVCKKNVVVSVLEEEDLYNELVTQANALGMESLTESQQLYVEGALCCESCYEEIDDAKYGIALRTASDGTGVAFIGVRTCGEACPNCVTDCPLRNEGVDADNDVTPGGV